MRCSAYLKGSTEVQSFRGSRLASSQNLPVMRHFDKFASAFELQIFCGRAGSDCGAARATCVELSSDAFGPQMRGTLGKKIVDDCIISLVRVLHREDIPPWQPSLREAPCKL